VKAIALMEEDKLVRRAVDSLMKRLGPVETQRFLSLPARKRLDSVRRHRLWQQCLKKDQFFDRVIR
jgi:hypothetical protein